MCQARSQGGCRGVPTPPSEINNIHNTNYLIQERPFDSFKPCIRASDCARSSQNLKTFLQHAPVPLDIYILYPPFIDSWICMHAQHMTSNCDFQLVGVSIHFEFVTLIFSHVRFSLHACPWPHQHANSTPPFQKVWLWAWLYNNPGL